MSQGYQLRLSTRNRSPRVKLSFSKIEGIHNQRMSFFQHPLSVVESSSIGDNTRIWAFAHILPGARIGAECNLCDHTFIENDVIIGDRVTIKCGVQLWDGIDVEDDVFIGPNATFTNDAFPRSKRLQEKLPRTRVRKGASIGANATILPGLTIGERSMIGAGSVVTRDVPADTIVAGNPARICGYAGVSEERRPTIGTPPLEPGIAETMVTGVTLHRLPRVDDLRGSLSFGEANRHVPFPVKRYFLVFGVSSQQIRGEHAHRTLHQFLICVHGTCNIVADDGATRQEFALDQPSVGLHIQPMTWAVQYKYSRDAVLLVLASDSYDAGDYIRDYSEFLSLRKSRA
jgi:acetyltransferase-like isoleucine patch superfamily enzyme